MHTKPPVPVLGLAVLFVLGRRKVESFHSAPGPSAVTDNFQSSCFHCGQPVPAGMDLVVNVDGVARRMCCAGCQAVCEAIIGNGLGEYYRRRAALPESAREAIPEELADLQLFDHPDFQQTFVRPLEGGEREADLILEGITCAACVWLNERHLAQLPGVVAVQVNYATRRARIRWCEEKIHLSAILEAVVGIGYRAHPYDPSRSEELARREQRAALWRLLVAGLGMMQVMMYALPVYISTADDMSPGVKALMQWASMLLTLPVIFYSAAPFFQRAWRDIRLCRAGMDVPVALGVGIAFGASAWATMACNGPVYFDSVSMFVFFLLGGRYLEMLARQRAVRGAETLGRLLPSFARRLSADGLVEEHVPASRLVVGDRVLVRPGETIVVDGEISAGQSEVSEAWLTGESIPLTKNVGDWVLGGSLNGSGVLEVRAHRVGEATRLAIIRRLMERAISERPRIVEQADRVAAGFTVVLLVLAVLAGVSWWLIDPARAVQIVVAVLVVSCPCALSLATPVALTVATDALARTGMLVTRGHAIETLAKARHFVFDKTGTLTTGVMQVVNAVCCPGLTVSQAVRYAAALELHSEHAIGRAIVAAAGEGVQAAEQVDIHPGSGVSGRIAGEVFAVGQVQFVEQCVGFPIPQELDSHGGEQTCVYLGQRGRWLAVLILDDQVRSDARGMLDGLQADGCRVSIFSGDSAAAVLRVANLLGVGDARAGLSPEGKHAALNELQAEGAVVAMVGDGINDAPVLAQAHVSIAMAGGTELARNQADILLLNDTLGSLLRGRHLAHKTQSVIHENLAWALVYNLLAIPAAMLGWVTPLIAGIGMGASSVLVVLNALRIARVK
jgi:P-type Cu2+ transporter